MPKITYVPKVFSAEHGAVIDKANEIIEAYQGDGYKLTLRQLYYQFVARDLIENTMRSYKRLGGIINDARLAGEIDWDAIEDRTRNLEAQAHWTNPQDIIDACARGYRIDKWAGQPRRIEVWIEKEALAGVFERPCQAYDVPYLSCRGYTSQSEMWAAAMRLKHYGSLGQAPLILHFGDHDPSGIDMTRDIEDRMEMFGVKVELRRLALNRDQVDEYQPPPNPAKLTDSRCMAYIASYGHDSWELDALEPRVLERLVADTIRSVRDESEWEESVETERRQRAYLEAASSHWGDICDMLDGRGSQDPDDE